MGAQVATPLAVALNELVQNAVEHAFAPPARQMGELPYELAKSAVQPGSPEATGAGVDADSGPGVAGGSAPPEVHISFGRHGDELFVQVKDNGIGLPPGFSIDATTSLGLSIVRGLGQQSARREDRDVQLGRDDVELVIPVTRAETSDLARI